MANAVEVKAGLSADAALVYENVSAMMQISDPEAYANYSQSFDATDVNTSLAYMFSTRANDKMYTAMDEQTYASMSVDNYKALCNKLENGEHTNGFLGIGAKDVDGIKDIQAKIDNIKAMEPNNSNAAGLAEYQQQLDNLTAQLGEANSQLKAAENRYNSLGAEAEKQRCMYEYFDAYARGDTAKLEELSGKFAQYASQDLLTMYPSDSSNYASAMALSNLLANGTAPTSNSTQNAAPESGTIESTMPDFLAKPSSGDLDTSSYGSKASVYYNTHDFASAMIPMITTGQSISKIYENMSNYLEYWKNNVLVPNDLRETDIDRLTYVYYRKLTNACNYTESENKAKDELFDLIMLNMAVHEKCNNLNALIACIDEDVANVFANSMSAFTLAEESVDSDDWSGSTSAHGSSTPDEEPVTDDNGSDSTSSDSYTGGGTGGGGSYSGTGNTTDSSSSSSSGSDTTTYDSNTSSGGTGTGGTGTGGTGSTSSGGNTSDTETESATVNESDVRSGDTQEEQTMTNPVVPPTEPTMTDPVAPSEEPELIIEDDDDILIDDETTDNPTDDNASNTSGITSFTEGDMEYLVLSDGTIVPKTPVPEGWEYTGGYKPGETCYVYTGADGKDYYVYSDGHVEPMMTDTSTDTADITPNDASSNDPTGETGGTTYTNPTSNPSSYQGTSNYPSEWFEPSYYDNVRTQFEELGIHLLDPGVCSDPNITATYSGGMLTAEQTAWVKYVLENVPGAKFGDVEKPTFSVELNAFVYPWSPPAQ